MHVLLNLEHLVLLLHLHTQADVETFSGSSCFVVIFSVDVELRVVGILHPSPLIVLIHVDIDTLRHETLVELVEHIEFARKVDHRTRLALLVDHEQRRDACRTCHKGVVGTECRCDMHDARTVVGGHVVASDYAESLVGCILEIAVGVHLHRLHPWEQLLIVHAHQVGTLIFSHHLERHQLVARLIVFERQPLGLLVKVVVKQRFCHDCRDFLAVISIV